MSDMVLFIAVVTAWISGWACAGLLDALWGFNEWDFQSVALVTTMWVGFGIISIVFVVNS